MEKLNNEEIENLIKQFKIISRKRWIKSVNKGLGSIGYTFEKELDKVPDSLYFPDYYGTEIKCTGRYSRYPISLFTVSFDGPTFPEINRIIEKYGYKDKDYVDKNVLFADVKFTKKTLIASGYYFKLEIDYNEEKIYLCVYDLNGFLIERESFVYFKSIYDHLVLKLNRLAVVYASKKMIADEKYFRYYKMEIYQLRGFDKFLELLEKDIIKVNLIARISKSGVDEGRYRNKNLGFMLKKDFIGALFEKIYSYDYDKESNNNFFFIDNFVQNSKLWYNLVY